MNRVARRIQEGETIMAQQAASYFYGVARNVLREYWKATHRATAASETWAHAVPLSSAPDEVAAQATERRNQEQRRVD